MVDDTNIVKVSTNQGFTNMTNVTTNTVFEAFIEADKAMKELPALRDELGHTKDALAQVQKKHDDVAYDLMDRERMIETLRASLSQREAELARATFRADAVEAKHRALRSLLGGDDSPGVAVDGALSAAPKPSGDEVAPKPNDAIDTIEPTPSGQSVMGPISTNKESAPVETISNSNGGQSDADPTMNTMTTTSSHTEPQPESNTSAHGTSNNPSVEGSVSAGEGVAQTGTLTTDGSNRLSEAADHATDVSTTTTCRPSHLAYSGRLYTSKPDGMEWGYWIVNGGEPAYWMNSDYIADLKSEFAPYAGHAQAA